MFPLCPSLHWIVQANLNDDVHEIVDSAIVSMYRKLLACRKHYICFKLLQITMYTYRALSKDIANCRGSNCNAQCIVESDVYC